MTSLIGLLQQGANSLNVEQTQTGVVGQNIANANTPGYARRDVVVGELGGALPGSGSVTAGMVRAQDFVLSRNLFQQHGLATEGSVVASGLHDIETLLQSGQSNLSQRMTDLGTALSQLAPSPQDMVLRNQVLASGQAVVTEFNRVAQALDGAQSSNLDTAQSLVPQINELAQRIAALNQMIAGGTGGSVATPNDQAASLSQNLDLRDQAVSDLQALTGGQVLKNADGSIDVLAGGLSLVHGATANALSVSVAGPGAAPAVQIGGSTAQSMLSGQLGGALLLVTTAQKTLAQFDQLAYDMSAAINAQHAIGVGLDGAGGRPFFAPLAAVSGAALSLQLDPGLTPTTLAAGFSNQSGDNRNALALANLINQPVLEGGKSTFSNVYQRISGQLGTTVDQADANSQVQSAQETALKTAQQSLAGVSTDEETAKLQAFQRSYEASATFIRTVDEMLSTVTTTMTANL